MPRLLVSAAHTTESPGVVVENLKEAELTRSILKKLLPHLDTLGVDYKAVPLDLPLMQRINWINSQGYSEEKGDLFVEIHINDGGKRGFEFWYSGSAADDNNSQKLAEYLMENLSKKTGYEKQGAKSEHDHEIGSLLILNQTHPIAAALELLYIDNPEDQKILRDEAKLDELAKALAECLNDFIKANPEIGKNTKKKPAPIDEMDDLDDLLDDDFDDMFGDSGAPTPKQPVMPSSFPRPNFPKNPSGPAAGKSAPLLMDRQEREKMIKETYSKLIGKEISQATLTYYLNMGVSPDELTNKLIESDDFKGLVSDAKGFKEANEKATKAESELLGLRGKIKDLETMTGTMQRVIDFKNKKIGEMLLELERRGIVKPGQYPGSESLKKTNDDDYPGLKAKKKKDSNIFDILIRIFKLS